MKPFIFDPSKFGPVIAELMAGDRIPELGPGQPNAAVRPLLESLTIAKLFPSGVADADMARGCLAGLWLYHDFLDESHAISQDIHTPTGSYWHAIMHRREADYGNAKYWFRRVGRHPVLDELGPAIKALAAVGEPISKAVLNGEGNPFTFDPFAFVDWCESCACKSDAESLACRRTQFVETASLFNSCWLQAIGT